MTKRMTILWAAVAYHQHRIFIEHVDLHLRLYPGTKKLVNFFMENLSCRLSKQR